MSYFAGAPLLIAHRGGAKLGPENTVAAFRQAVDDWDADVLEMDVRLSADGEVIVIHDETVDRTSDGTGRVADMPWAQIRELDAGYRFNDLAGDPSFRGKGVGFPLFRKVLEAFPTVRINVESKASEAAKPLVDLIRAAKAEHRVLVAAEFEKTRASVTDYSGPWGASRADVTPFWLLYRIPFFGPRYCPDTDALQVPETSGRLRIVTPGFIRAAHVRNIPVHVWTIDDPEVMVRLLEWEVDGIQTDRPDVLAQVLSDVAGRPPPPGLRIDSDQGP